MSEDQEARTSNFKDGNEGGKRRPGSILADSMDIAEKAALTTPEQGDVNDDGEFEGGEAPGEGTIAYDPTVEQAREEQEDAESDRVRNEEASDSGA